MTYFENKDQIINFLYDNFKINKDVCGNIVSFLKKPKGQIITECVLKLMNDENKKNVYSDNTYTLYAHGRLFIFKYQFNKRPTNSNVLKIINDNKKKKHYSIKHNKIFNKQYTKK